MARIDVKTLVFAFEKRISELEKNPPDKISTAVILSLVERAIDEELKNHFIELTKKELQEQIHQHFKDNYESFTATVLQEVLSCEEIKQQMIDNLKSYVKSKIIAPFNK